MKNSEWIINKKLNVPICYRNPYPYGRDKTVPSIRSRIGVWVLARARTGAGKLIYDLRSFKHFDLENEFVNLKSKI